MFDLPMGFHQLAVALASQDKLAFHRVDGIKWAYTVMPFGPTNGPATFITFIHDLDSVWKEHAHSNSIPIDDDTNTKIMTTDGTGNVTTRATATLLPQVLAGSDGADAISVSQTISSINNAATYTANLLIKPLR